MELDPARRERILDAAAKLIVENGLQCSMAAIADAAGVATGSIYNYFRSKDDLIRGVYTRLAAIITANLVPTPADPGGPRERIMRYIYDYIDFIWRDRQRALLFEYLSNVPLISGAELSATFDEVTQYSIALMREAQVAGLLLDLPPATMSGYIGGGIRNTLKWRRFNPAPLSDGERDEIALMSWNAIAALPARGL
ncbi:TetR/AcrR family transcriptional regulator [Rhizobium sp. NPDC090279]|uniref:TetR/AcrR family transcriptional regulator n=1 Tax=Rhizobium sp. NPDC090279 TaxID=3364499 RepID=UPI00383B1E16